MTSSDSILETCQEDRDSRSHSIVNPRVYELQGPATELLPPGSGALILASQSTEVFSGLEEALANGDVEGINSLIEIHKQQSPRLEEVPIEEALRELISTPVYGDLRYGGKTLVTNAFTTERVGLTRIFFPFAGGLFNPESFTFAKFASSRDDSGQLNALVVLHQPRLSNREAAVLNRLPEAQRELLFGEAGGIRACTPGALFATVTAGLIVAAVGTAIGNCAPQFDDGFQEVVLPETFNNARVNIAVRELVNIRRTLLLNAGV